MLVLWKMPLLLLNFATFQLSECTGAYGKGFFHPTAFWSKHFLIDSSISSVSWTSWKMFTNNSTIKMKINANCNSIRNVNYIWCCGLDSRKCVHNEHIISSISLHCIIKNTPQTSYDAHYHQTMQFNESISETTLQPNYQLKCQCDRIFKSRFKLSDLVLSLFLSLSLNNLIKNNNKSEQKNQDKCWMTFDEKSKKSFVHCKSKSNSLNNVMEHARDFELTTISHR